MDAARLMEENIREFSHEAEEAFLNRAYNSAVTLYFKALAVLADWYLYQRTRSVPKNHNERFILLKQHLASTVRALGQDLPALPGQLSPASHAPVRARPQTIL